MADAPNEKPINGADKRKSSQPLEPAVNLTATNLMCQFIEDSTKVPQTCPNSGHLRKISLQQTRGLQRPEQSQRQLSERLRWMDTRPEKSNRIKGHNGRGGQGERKCRPLSPVIRHPHGIIPVSAKLDPSETRSFLLRKTRQLCRCFFGFRQIITGR